jgi:hypothetical protein
VAILVFSVGVLVSGCSGATVKRDEIIKALNLSQVEGRDTYTVNGDPFCEIRTELLDSKEMVDLKKQAKKLKKVLVTNAAGTVGVIGVPPFGGSCKQTVVQGLSGIT